MTTETLIWLIPLPPILAFFLIVLVSNRSKACSHTLAVGAALLSLVGAMVVFARALGVHELGTVRRVINRSRPGDTWLKVGARWIHGGFSLRTVLMIFIWHRLSQLCAAR
jgi:NADH-quinone oxidoreductase subunit L